jgi:hypothetical protein
MVVDLANETTEIGEISRRKEGRHKIKMADKKLKLICTKSKDEHSISQKDQLTGLTIDQVKERLGQATGLSLEELNIIFNMQQEGHSLEQIHQRFDVELEVLKQFLPQLIDLTVETHALADSVPPTTTEETIEPHKPQPTKTLPKPQHIPTFFYRCESNSNELHRVDLLTGEQFCFQIHGFLFKPYCRWSELNYGSLLVTGGHSGEREVRTTRLDAVKSLS